MAKYTAEITLPEHEDKLFREYLDCNCFDAQKWLSRQLQNSLYNAVSRFRQPKGKPNKSYTLKPISRQAAVGKQTKK